VFRHDAGKEKKYSENKNEEVSREHTHHIIIEREERK
jgi:hypothetical protein